MNFAKQLSEALQEEEISEDKLLIYKSIDVFFSAVKESFQDLYAIQEFRNNLQSCLRLISESPKKNLKDYARDLFGGDKYFNQVLSEERLSINESSVILDVSLMYYSIETTHNILQKAEISETFSSGKPGN